MTVFRKSELFVMTKVKDLTNYVITITEKSPKKFRFTLIHRMQNLSLDIISDVHTANTYEKGTKLREDLQEDAKRKLALLDYVAQIAMEQKCILNKQYKNLSLYIAEALNYLQKWINKSKNDNT